MAGSVFALCISEKKGTEKHEVDHARFIINHGIEGDAHAGKWHRQVSLLAEEKVEEFRARGADVDNGAFGENVLISGLDPAALPIGTTVQIGEAILQVTQLGKECHAHCRIYDAVGDCIMPREGVFAEVLHGGIVTKGDVVQILGCSHEPEIDF